MLYLDLCVPVFLESQLKTVAENTDYSLSDIRRLAYHAAPAFGIITQGEHKFELFPTQEEYDDEEGRHVLKDKSNLPTCDFLTGTDAILWLCMEKNIELEAITKIDIPDSVYYECDKETWSDICSFFADISSAHNRVKRLISLGAPQIIIENERRELWGRLELLEAGQIGSSKRQWTHGRILRSLNDVGFSLDGGWFPYMREHLDCTEEEPEEKKARHEKMYKQKLEYFTSVYMKRGMNFGEALIRAKSEADGNPAKRVCTSEGMGFWIPRKTRPALIAEFLRKHKAAFIKSKSEQEIYDRIQAGDDLDEIFEDSLYETDRNGSGFEHWAVAVANVMTRENDIGFSVFLTDPEDKYKNRSCIMFEDKSPWLYTEKEKKLSHNMLYQILDRYALELHLSVSDCYYILDIRDA